MKDCIFCKIVGNRSESDVTVYENDNVIALISLHQKSANFGHVLLLPKAHIENLYELPATLDAPIMSALRVLARATKKAFSSEGIQIRQNNESAAGQDVFHLHFHIIPRFVGDAFDDRPYNKLPVEIRENLAIRLRAAVLSEIEQKPGLTVVQDPSPEAFLEHAGSMLYGDEPTNSLMLGLCGNILRAKERPKHLPVLIRLLKDGRTVTAAIQIPPRNLVITYAKTEELEFLAKHLRSLGAVFPGVVGPAREAEAFSIIWSNLSGKKTKLGMGQRIYKIDKGVIPDTPGHLRLAEINETDIVAQWFVAFADESLPLHERKSIEERRPDAVRAIESQLAYFWVIDDEPVSMAHVSRHTENGVSVNAVYTPKNSGRRVLPRPPSLI